jgi:hypothetical protein
MEKMALPIPAIPAIPAIPPIPPVTLNGDHDLLQRLDTKVDALKDDIKAIKDGTATQIANSIMRLELLEKWQASLTGDNGVLENIPKNEDRISNLEKGYIKIIAWAGGAAAVVALLIDMLSRFYGFGK